MNSFDYIFTGAGCSGLSLLHHLLPSLEDGKTILIIDNTEKNTNDHNWCFWSTTDFGYKSAQKHSWNKACFRTESKIRIDQLKPYQYYHIAAIDFYDEILQKIKQHPSCTILKADISDLRVQENVCIVSTSEGIFRAKHVFNSIIKLAATDFPAVSMYQHFFGMKLRIDPKHNIGSDHITLMDFSFSNKDKVQFAYILPFTSTEVLFEYTEFSSKIHSREEYLELLTDYLKSKGIADYQIIEEEIGRIPMFNFRTRVETPNQRIHHIGIAGGLTKPTTGYTFRNIQIDSQKIVKSLKKSDPFINRFSTNKRFKFYDKLLLGIIESEPQMVKIIMTKLFLKNKMSHILKFLDEESSISEEIRIFFSIPWKPFLKQLFKD
ncbi:MAG: hypothetical protein COW03_02210 [Cytophagales bacterium CG12_big_fil_rev_8_21_14_0_65_40_12]|nr:MAG: hypothetical protein COW03_02210 [Cytophagales bacterium CG12_big_fil_rev_8_21_14_0_65_40_12]PIW05161.1 MAG: hypothetical protein COW40_06065 [Cytophagales bacterium CG17_big_fil_post_rev_8_21_14_2_50_40_13]